MAAVTLVIVVAGSYFIARNSVVVVVGIRVVIRIVVNSWFLFKFY